MDFEKLTSILKIKDYLIVNDIHEDFWKNESIKGIQLIFPNGSIELYNNGEWKFFEKDT